MVAAFDAGYVTASWKAFEVGAKVFGAYTAAQGMYISSQVAQGAFMPEAPENSLRFVGATVTTTVQIRERYSIDLNMNDIIGEVKFEPSFSSRFHDSTIFIETSIGPVGER